MDFLVYLTMGAGFKPVLKYASERGQGDEEAAEQLKEHDAEKGITAKLKEIDEAVGAGAGYAHSLRYKIEWLLTAAMVFGRAGLVRRRKEPSYTLFPLHPRDITWNVVDEDWTLRAVQSTLAPEPYSLDDILYAEWNAASPVYNVMYYGFSFMQRMIDSARALRRIKGVDMQLIARRRWAASAIIAVKRHEGKADAQTVAARLNAGDFMITEEDDPQEAYAVHPIPLDRGTEKAVDLATWLTRDIISLAGIPTTLFYDESSANHSVFDIRIRAFQKQIEEEFRPWAAQVLERWYAKNLQDHFPEEVGKYKIECEFEPIDFSSLGEKAEAVQKLNDIMPLKTDYIGKILHVDDLASKVDIDEQERRRQPAEQEAKNGGLLGWMKK